MSFELVELGFVLGEVDLMEWLGESRCSISRQPWGTLTTLCNLPRANSSNATGIQARQNQTVFKTLRSLRVDIYHPTHHKWCPCIYRNCQLIFP